MDWQQFAGLDVAMTAMKRTWSLWLPHWVNVKKGQTNGNRPATGVTASLRTAFLSRQTGACALGNTTVLLSSRMHFIARPRIIDDTIVIFSYALSLPRSLSTHLNQLSLRLHNHLDLLRLEELSKLHISLHSCRHHQHRNHFNLSKITKTRLKCILRETSQ
jgi:hypothetical protein